MQLPIQHPAVRERADRTPPYWFVRIQEPAIDKDGHTVRLVRKLYNLGLSQGKNRITKKQAEAARDHILERVNKPQELAGDTILFSKLIAQYRHIHMNNCVCSTTRDKYEAHLRRYIEPKWSSYRLGGMDVATLQEWFNSLDLAWNTKTDIRNLMSGIFTQAEEWGYWAKRNPLGRIKVGRKREVYAKIIPAPEVAAAILDDMREPCRLIAEVALLTGARISEILGLRWKNVLWTRRSIHIEERWFRGDLDVTKSQAGVRTLALSPLMGRLSEIAQKRFGRNEPMGDCYVFDRGDGSGEPTRDETVRKALKAAGKRQGFDFLGFGLHTLRRANLTWRQEAGFSTIEASKMAGHSRVHVTYQYTQVQLKRQEDNVAAVAAMLRKPKVRPAESVEGEVA